MASPFKFKNAALMMALAAAYPVQSFAASAGTALLATGEVSVRRGASSDNLARGSSVESGDIIVTGPAGRAQLRFSDGGMVALSPNSQFNISKYADVNDPKQDAFLVDLLRGGMRAITGLIGKRNRDNYKVTTTTATIGIRGSAFLMNYLPDGTLVVSTEQDAIEVCTQAGCTGLAAGESARVVSSTQPAVRTSTRASIPSPDPLRTPTTVGDGTTGAGKSNLVTAPTQSIFTGLAFVSAGLPASGSKLDQRQYSNGSLITAPSSGAPLQYKGENNDLAVASGTTTVVSSTGSYAGNDLLILGTWSADTWTAGSGGVGTGNAGAALSSTGFATGQTTSSTALSSLTGMRAQYKLDKATPVYATNGQVGAVTAGSLAVDFLGVGNYANLSLSVAMPAITSRPAGSTTPTLLPSNNTNFSLVGSGVGTGAGFAGALSVASNDCINGTAACGIGYFNGFVSGSNANKAGVSFTANDTSYGNFGGAATFAQSSIGSTPSTTVGTGGMYAVVGSYRSGEGVVDTYEAMTSSPSGSGFSYYNNTSLQFKGDALTVARTESGCLYNGSSTYSTTSAHTRTGTDPLNYGALGKTTDADFIGWGVWAQGTYSQGSGSGGTSTSQLSNTHYIVGQPTPVDQMPRTGTANYSLVGSTAPTATGGTAGAAQAGQLVGAALSVDFRNSSASFTGTAKFGANSVNVSSPLYVSGNRIGSCSQVSVNGIFTGNQAYRAGLVYQTYAPEMGTVTGAAAFQRSGAFGVSPNTQPQLTH